ISSKETGSASSKIVVAETWDEFHEGTDIADSRQYGQTYIDVNRQYAKVFKEGLGPSFPRGAYSDVKFVADALQSTKRRGWRICPVDWEIAALGPGLIDLTALTAGNWTREQKTKLVAPYTEALEPCNGWPPSMPELMEAV